MDELKLLLQNMLNEELKQIVLSDARDKEQAFKVKIRPVRIGGKLFFQETLYRGTQVFHHNYEKAEMLQRIQELMSGQFGQAQLAGIKQDASVLVSRKGRVTIKCRNNAAKGNDAVQGNGAAKGNDAAKGAGSNDAEGGEVKGNGAECNAAGNSTDNTKKEADRLAHNRVKHYILEEGRPVEFLVELGVQTPEGRVTKARYDKFRQINRYLEFIEDVLEELPKDGTVRIIDFGCGKSYLTFAMYYYLHELKKRDIQVTGLDLKKDVIDHCNRVAQKCGYDRLHFEMGDISTYEGADQVDMVVSLHACDTATDYALDKAVKWGAKVIMAVPCCQHEVNRQIKCSQLRPVLKYGLLKERFSALVTDAVRANLLEQQGYDTQILEFIDMEHTPKNLLIRAVKRADMRPRRPEALDEFQELLGIAPTLSKLL